MQTLLRDYAHNYAETSLRAYAHSHAETLLRYSHIQSHAIIDRYPYSKMTDLWEVTLSKRRRRGATQPLV